MKNRLGRLLIFIGVAAIFSAGVLWIHNIIEENKAADFSTRVAQALLVQIEQNPVDVAVAEDSIDQGYTERYACISLDGEEYIGVLKIPALKLGLPVNAEWNYPKLKSSPCRFAGSIEGNNIVIVAHNYKRHFGKINTLKTGSEVVFVDIYGDKHYFSVAQVGVVKPESTAEIVYGGYALTLVTCTYSGRTRCAVKCELAIVENR